MTAQFWMVLDSRIGSVCQTRHDNCADAEDEAERLAVKENRPFYVLEAVDICRPAPKVLWEDLEMSSNAEAHGRRSRTLEMMVVGTNQRRDER